MREWPPNGRQSVPSDGNMQKVLLVGSVVNQKAGWANPIAGWQLPIELRGWAKHWQNVEQENHNIVQQILENFYLS